MSDQIAITQTLLVRHGTSCAESVGVDLTSDTNVTFWS